METIQAWVTLGKDIITGLAAVIAAYVAITGLQTWKRQMTANAEHDLARRVLVLVYRVRNASNRCRLGPAESNEKLDWAKQLHAEAFAELEDAEAALAVELLEAEAVWGDEEDYEFSMITFRSITQKVIAAYLLYYSDYVPSEEIHPNLKDDSYSILFGTPYYPKDEFSSKLDAAVSRIEDFLRPKLTLKKR